MKNPLGLRNKLDLGIENRKSNISSNTLLLKHYDNNHSVGAIMEIQEYEIIEAFKIQNSRYKLWKQKRLLISFKTTDNKNTSINKY